ncbi:TlpA family protein disulfide reductase [Zhouia amylolytica]|uniref:TlpA family protein disulfide reductase n=1 Tax=Zhouia amylolytica TaxID=376730 RepID=UPI0020CC18C1|nr:TlpA disulfide reductase family protein [Zhouia amylolytica]MCQ0110432.1 TlpA family protein disulfide reductase [Zhouia amylolytica]
MRKLSLILSILFLGLMQTGCIQEEKEQEASINFKVENSSVTSISILKDNFTNANRLFENNGRISVPLTDGKGHWSVKLSKPIFVTAVISDKNNQNKSYIFCLSPGDELNVSFESKGAESTYVVSGAGSENNQPAIQELFKDQSDLKAYRKDSLPGNVLSAIKEISNKKQKILADYNSKYHPSDELKEIYALYVDYIPMQKYIIFKGQQPYHIREPFTRNEDSWQAIEDSLINRTPVSNDKMLVFDRYCYFLGTYLTRFKEGLWQHPERLKDYYGTATQEEAVKINTKDPENLLKEKIIEKHFTGKTAEFLYGTLFKGAIDEKEDNLPEIFSRFKQQYPQSQYISYVEPAIQKIEKQRARTLTDKMVFVDNSHSYQTFDDILKLVKGKTVLLDMWGTWCGPCRSEISKNSEAIKSHFKDKGLDYLYIANYDTAKEEKWKELIAYYNLTGTHVLANKALTANIMEEIKGKGFPTYAIIKKDGTFELSEAGYPMKRDVLIKQIEEALTD